MFDMYFKCIFLKIRSILKIFFIDFIDKELKDKTRQIKYFVI